MVEARSQLLRAVKPGQDALVDAVLRTTRPGARVLDLGGVPAPSAKLAARRVLVLDADEALAGLAAHAADPHDAIMTAWPTSFAPLLPLLHAAHGALKPDGRLHLLDLVWQTAPTPELLRAFAAAPGREKVRPIEGYEMQIDHAGFDVEARLDLPRESWRAGLTDAQRAAVDQDARGAARLSLWTLRMRPE